MVLVLLGYKRNAAPGAEGRFNPVDTGKTASAKTLLAFGQEGFAAVTLRRQKKLEEGLEEYGHPFQRKMGCLTRSDGGDCSFSS